MADQRSQTNMAMVLHLLQDRLTKATCLNSGGTHLTISHAKRDQPHRCSSDVGGSSLDLDLDLLLLPS